MPNWLNTAPPASIYLISSEGRYTLLSWSVSISGHVNGPDENPASASCWYTQGDGHTSRSKGFSGELKDVAEQAVAFIAECQAEEYPQAPAEAPAEEAAE